MQIKLRLIKPPAFLEPPPHPWPEGMRSFATRKFEVGDCWYATKDSEGGWHMYADGPYQTPIRGKSIAPEHVDARPMIVVVPSNHPQGYPWCVHTRTMGENGYGSGGWAVTGELPLITLHPSVNMKGAWHGFIKQGALI